jgi:C_GCAxxG_C_C family probable redox protein
MERAEHARQLFLSGHNCAQSVVLSYADSLKYSRELAVKIAAGFGGGMGKQQRTCGAVTGAYMVLGLIEGEHAGDNEELKARTYGSVKEFAGKFEEAFGSTSCLEITGCDFSTAEGNEKFREDGIMEKICADCVEKAVRIVESLTGK